MQDKSPRAPVRVIIGWFVNWGEYESVLVKGPRFQLEKSLQANYNQSTGGVSTVL